MRTPDEVSPYSLIQEELWRDAPPDWPWRVLVVCKLMNLATAKKAREVMVPLFERYPTRAEAASADRDEMAETLRPLGLQSRRADAIVRMSSDLVVGVPVEDCFGVGKYAIDSFRIFVGREMVEDVTDKELRRHLEWSRTKIPT